MRESDGRRLVSRVRGRQALERSLRLLLIRAHRFGRHRARTTAEREWAARLIDGLSAILSDTTPPPELADLKCLRLPEQKLTERRYGAANPDRLKAISNSGLLFR